ncbi:hypothetical protein FRC05_003302 [Tulasnella sp. 425]|nr:hypothetical protein FRC05_003302 [Tulasnella sp. 425]
MERGLSQSEKRIRDLEHQVATLEQSKSAQEVENANLRELLGRLQNENLMLKQSAFSFEFNSAQTPRSTPTPTVSNSRTNPTAATSPVYWSPSTVPSATPEYFNSQQQAGGSTSNGTGYTSLLSFPSLGSTDNPMSMGTFLGNSNNNIYNNSPTRLTFFSPPPADAVPSPYTSLASNPMYSSYTDFSAWDQFFQNAALDQPLAGVGSDPSLILYANPLRESSTTMPTVSHKFTTEAVDLSRLVRKRGNAAHALAGFSDVWKGEMTETGKPIAIKVLRVVGTNKPDDPESDRLRTDQIRCSNGNIMEYIAKNPNADRRRLIIQVAEGLVYLHGREPLVVHSDIKPENIVVGDEGDAKICDFGISKLMMDIPSGFTTTATAKCTVRYSSKELLEEGARNTTMSDVYAFGMLMLHVMTGKAPYFKCCTDPPIIMSIMNGKTPAPADYPELPSTDSYWGVMLRCWNEDPNKRPTMASLLNGSLQGIHDDVFFLQLRDSFGQAHGVIASRALLDDETNEDVGSVSTVHQNVLPPGTAPFVMISKA